MLPKIKGQGYRTRLLNARDEYWDRRLGVRTFGYYPSSGENTDDWRRHYRPTPYFDIFSLLDRVGLRESDVFTDLGCGLGRANFAASWKGAKRSIGVDVVEELTREAIRNYRQSRLADRDVEFVCVHAAHFDLSETTVLFMANPFGEATFRSVIERVKRDRPKTADPLRIIFVNPIYNSVLERAGQFRCIEHIPSYNPWFSDGPHYKSTIWQFDGR